MPTKLRNTIQYSAVALLIFAAAVSGWYCSSVVHSNRQARRVTPVEEPDASWSLPEQITNGSRQREAGNESKSRRFREAIPGLIPMPVGGRLY